MYQIREQNTRGTGIWEMESLTEAYATFDTLAADLKPGHILELLDEDGTALRRVPPIMHEADFVAVIRTGGSQKNIKVTIPANIRDAMLLEPGDTVRVTVRRDDHN